MKATKDPDTFANLQDSFNAEIKKLKSLRSESGKEKYEKTAQILDKLLSVQDEQFDAFSSVFLEFNTNLMHQRFGKGPSIARQESVSDELLESQNSIYPQLSLMDELKAGETKPVINNEEADEAD